MICLVIINHKSCANIATKAMMDKIKLPIIVHPQPYYIRWMESRELVSEQVKVLILIPNIYFNHVMFNVVPAVVSHIVFRNPWIVTKE